MESFFLKDLHSQSNGPIHSNWCQSLGPMTDYRGVPIVWPTSVYRVALVRVAEERLSHILYRAK